MDDILKTLNKAKKKSEWDEYVPVVYDKTDNTVHAYITDSIDVPSEYNKLCYILDSAKKSDKFTLHINTPGGMVDSALMLINSIKNSKATVKARLSGTVASAGTIISLSCDTLEVSPHTSFMIHNYSSGMQGKGHEMKAYQNFIDANLNKAFKAMYSGFLTDTEMDEVIEGKDLWINSDEVAERWQNVLEFRKGEKSGKA